MGFYVVGVDHKTCPISIREAIALDPQVAGEWVSELAEVATIDEVAVLSTCARTEVYLWCEQGGDEAQAIVADRLCERNPSASQYVNTLSDSAAVVHVFRVTAGLESQVVGEDEIAGQMRAAANQARSLHSLGANLDSLFRAATACSRRLRAETTLGAINTSVASAAADMFRETGSIKHSRVLILGSGKVARMVAAEFREAKRLVMASRTPSSLDSFSASNKATTMDLADALKSLQQFDVVICATRSRKALVEVKDLRRATPLVVFDLSIPRNVAVPKKRIPGLTIFDIDTVTSANDPSEDSSLIESVLEGEIREFLGNQSARAVGPIIAALRDHVERVRLTELQRVRMQLASMDSSQREAVETMTGRMIDQMFHHLVVRLRLAAITDPDLIKAAEFFFAHGKDSIFPIEESAESRAAEKMTQT